MALSELVGFAISEIKAEVFPAVVGDVMDSMGLVNQYLPPEVGPLDPAMTVLGLAMPVVEADLGDAEEPSQPFGSMMRALDSLKAGDVYLCSGSHGNYALWGELMSHRAQHLGAVGAVVNGFSRDTDGILELGFPTFSHGSYGQDQGVRGHVVDFATRIDFGEVSVSPADVVFGDRDGVCIVPRDVAKEVFTRSFEKVRKENLVRTAIIGGMSASEAYDTYGVL